MQKVLLPLALMCSFAWTQNSYAIEPYGLWEKKDSSNTYTFRPLGGNGLALVIVAGNYQDIYTGILDGTRFDVCAVDSEPFSACISGTINSDTSISGQVDSCTDKSPDIQVCKYFSTTVELTREVFYDINGIFLVSNGKYFMIENSGGRITAHDINPENGEVDGYSGDRDGNTGSVTPFDNSGPYLNFEITSASTLSATVTKCNDCDSDDAAKTPPGTVFSLTRVTD
jgi:hypothetical protein